MTHKEPKFAPKIALYQPDIPQNTASIIRTCSCLGIMLEIIEPCGFIINDRKFKRVVMDYYDAKNIQFYKSPKDFFISKRNTRIILMTTKSKKSYKEFLFKKNDTVLFGRESSGVPTSVHKKVSNRLTIPMMNKKRSLNLSSSVSIVVSKILNQTNF
ncbi:tRNA methyltransferase [Candidatus Pelagibacter sp.]|nr:tRNA methyltransferase [Candidatus Pelagibacter sp.]